MKSRISMVREWIQNDITRSITFKGGDKFHTYIRSIECEGNQLRYVASYHGKVVAASEWEVYYKEDAISE